MRFLIEALLAAIAVVALVAAGYGFLRGNWQHGLIELVIAALAGGAALWVRSRRGARMG